MTKVELIESMSHEELMTLFDKLIVILGYTNIVVCKNYMTAVEVGKISNLTWLFIFPQGKMSGNIDINELVSVIKDSQSKVKTDKTIVVSNYHISNGLKDSLQNSHVFCDYIDRD